MFDIITTFYAVNVTGLAVELNPLGWPIVILGALAFYAPSLIFSYILLSKIKENTGFYATIGATLITLALSAMNLFAGAQNFQVFVDTAMLATGVGFGLLVVIGIVCLIIPFGHKKNGLHRLKTFCHNVCVFAVRVVAVYCSCDFKT